MTNIVWPENLRIPGISALSSKFHKAFIRTEMDAGPAKQRLRFTSVPKEFTGTLILTEKERQILEDFFVNELCYGTLRFKMKNPQNGSVEEFRFTDVYSESGNDGGLYEISLPLEKLA